MKETEEWEAGKDNHAQNKTFVIFIILNWHRTLEQAILVSRPSSLPVDIYPTCFNRPFSFIFAVGDEEAVRYFPEGRTPPLCDSEPQTALPAGFCPFVPASSLFLLLCLLFSFNSYLLNAYHASDSNQGIEIDP